MRPHFSLRRPNSDGVCFSEILGVLADHEPRVVIRFGNRLKVAIIPVFHNYWRILEVCGRYTTDVHVEHGRSVFANCAGQCRIYVLRGRCANRITRPPRKKNFDRNICSPLIYIFKYAYRFTRSLLAINYSR